MELAVDEPFWSKRIFSQSAALYSWMTSHTTKRKCLHEAWWRPPQRVASRSKEKHDSGDHDNVNKLNGQLSRDSLFNDDCLPAWYYSIGSGWAETNQPSAMNHVARSTHSSGLLVLVLVLLALTGYLMWSKAGVSGRQSKVTSKQARWQASNNGKP
jgi:hypothetical protein